MPKLFVVSDIHSYYEPLKKGLDEKGFDPTNEDHWLIVCGDAFDRGDDSVEVLHYLMTLDRKILIRGNHDDLLEECCLRGFPHKHDRLNGTSKTIYNLGGSSEFDVCCDVAHHKLAGYRNTLVNYFETENYIFVHGWIPCEEIGGDPSQPWLYYEKTYEYNPNWRDCSDVEWEIARWTNGIKRAHAGIIEPNKTIVCGHWHCSYGHSLDSANTDTFVSEFKEDAIWEPWYHTGCIAIDRCTAHTGEVNVLVLEDSFILDKGNNSDGKVL